MCELVGQLIEKTVVGLSDASTSIERIETREAWAKY